MYVRIPLPMRITSHMASSNVTFLSQISMAFFTSYKSCYIDQKLWNNLYSNQKQWNAFINVIHIILKRAFRT